MMVYTNNPVLGRQRKADSETHWPARNQSRWAVFLRMICKVPLIHTHTQKERKRESLSGSPILPRTNVKYPLSILYSWYCTKPTFLITAPHHMALLLKPIFYNSPLVSSIPVVKIPFLRLKHSWQTCSVSSQFFSLISVWPPFLALH